MGLSELFSPQLLKDRVAVVTGGGTGIGLVIARDLASRGAKVALAARTLPRLEEAAASIRSSGGDAAAFACDISDAKQVQALAKAVDGRYGPADILINNAAANFIRPSERLSPLRWKTVLDIVLNGAFHCSLEFGRRMLERKSGRIISIVASYAWTGAPGFAPSASAKAGVVALTRSLGAEWAGRGVLVNAISPGPIDVPQTRERLWPTEAMRAKVLSSVPAGRFGAEEDISALVLFLASDLGRNIAGEVIVSDGGQCLGRGALDMLEEVRTVRLSKKS